MDVEPTTLAIQRYLGDLAAVRGDTPVDPIIRELLARSAQRLRVLCASLLHRSYPRLTRPPLNLDSDEMLSAVVERMLKALRETRPREVRQFFALANQHLRWELNDLARRLDAQPVALELRESAQGAPQSGGSTLGQNLTRILAEIDRLPEDERDAFSLIRMQGLTHAEAAAVLGVSQKTIQRRVHRSLLHLSARLSDLAPDFGAAAEA